MTIDPNPALRLEHWLRQAQAHEPSSQSVAQAWCAVFGLNWDDPVHRAELWARTAEISGLATEIRRRADDSPEGTTALAGFDYVEASLAFFLNAGSSVVKDQIKTIAPQGWQSLTRLAVVFAREGDTEPELDEALVDDLLAQTRDLVDDVRQGSGLDEALRRELLGHLLAVEEALARASIVGVAEVRRRLDGLVGAVLRLATRGKEALSSPALIGLGALIGSVAHLVGISDEMQQLALMASEFLPLPLELSGPSDGGEGAPGDDG